MVTETPRLLYICHAHQDEAWVEGVLVPALGLGEEQYWTRADNDVDAPDLDKVQEVVESSRYTLLVASGAARVDSWVQFGAKLAEHAALEEGRPRLILVTRDFSPRDERAKAILPLWARCLVAFDCSDPDRAASALTTIAAQLALATTVATPTECPYPGLRTFGPGDPAVYFDRPDLFFGREVESAAIVAQLQASRRVLLVGPSGCGKSSLMHARVLPALRQQDPDLAIVPTRPGVHPDAALRAALDVIDVRLGPAIEAYLQAGDDEPARAALTGATAGIRGLLDVDQLEEAFVGEGEAHRAESARFFARLAALGHVAGVTLLLGMRADFFGDLMRSPVWDVVKDQRVELAPLRGPALRLSITGPAEKVGVYVEADLVERLVREADMDRAAEALPLLQVALAQLWEHRQWRYLSLASYAELTDGDRRGLDVVLTRHADASVAILDEPVRELARRVLIDLVHLGEGRPDTRRRRLLVELRRDGDDDARVAHVVDHLAARRLIVTAAEAAAVAQVQVVALPTSTARGGTAEAGARSDAAPAERYADLAHDTLITGWPALANWIAQHRDRLRTQRRLEARAAGGGLLADSELPELTRWLAWIRTPEGRALGASTALVELTARSLAAARRRRVRVVTTVATVMATLAAIAAVALYQRQRAVAARDAEARSRSRAEDLVDHLAYDLPELLQAVGQPSAMQKSATKIDAYYRSLQQDEPALDRDQLRRLTAGRSALANVLLGEGKVDEAREGFLDSLRIAQQLDRSAPGDRQVERDLYVAHMGLSSSAAQRGDWTEALREARQAGELVAARQARDPNDRRALIDQAQTLIRIAQVEPRLADADPRPTLERAIAILEPIVEDDPTATEPVVALLKSYLALRPLLAPKPSGEVGLKIEQLFGKVPADHFDARLVDAASRFHMNDAESMVGTMRGFVVNGESAQRRALLPQVILMHDKVYLDLQAACADRHALARLAPRDLDWRRTSFDCRMELAALAVGAGDRRAATDDVMAAWRLQQAVEHDWPDDPEVLRDGGRALDLGAVIERQDGALENARADAALSVERARAYRAKLPGDGAARDDLAIALLGLANVEVDRAQFAAVTPLVDEAQALCAGVTQGQCAAATQLAEETPRGRGPLPFSLRLKVVGVTGLGDRVVPGMSCAAILRPSLARAAIVPGDDGCPRATISCNGWRVLGTDVAMLSLAVTGPDVTLPDTCRTPDRLDLATGVLHLEATNLLGTFTVDATVER